jgi:hypothetical protein
MLSLARSRLISLVSLRPSAAAVATSKHIMGRSLSSQKVETDEQFDAKWEAFFKK